MFFKKDKPVHKAKEPDVAKLVEQVNEMKIQNLTLKVAE